MYIQSVLQTTAHEWQKVTCENKEEDRGIKVQKLWCELFLYPMLENHQNLEMKKRVDCKIEGSITRGRQKMRHIYSIRESISMSLQELGMAETGHCGHRSFVGVHYSSQLNSM